MDGCHIIRKNLIYLFINLISLVFLSELAHSQQNQLTMPIQKDRKVELEAFLLEHPEGLGNVKTMKSRHANRVIAEIVILVQALQAGGYPVTLLLMETPNYSRSLALVEEGEVVVMDQSVWNSDCSEKVYATDAVIPNGRFIKGLYTAEFRQNQYSIRSISDLQNYSCVSSSNWNVDWATLKQIKFLKLHDVGTRETMCKLVTKRNVDFTLLEFSNEPDHAITVPTGRLLPVQGVQLALDGSRHLVVSKSNPDGKEVFAALQKGLPELIKNGIVERYYYEAGFYRSENNMWKTLKVGDVTN